MPYEPDGSFSLVQQFGTGTPPSNDFPPQVGQALDDMATSIAIQNIFSQSVVQTIAATIGTLVIGTPTGGNKGPGTLNVASTIYQNGNAVFVQTGNATGGLTITPTALGTISSGTITPNPATCLKQTLTNNGAFTIAAPTQIGDIELFMTNGASAVIPTFSGFTKQFIGDALDNTVGHKFFIFIYGFGSTTAYVVKALQ